MGTSTMEELSQHGVDVKLQYVLLLDRVQGLTRSNPNEHMPLKMAKPGVDSPLPPLKPQFGMIKRLSSLLVLVCSFCIILPVDSMGTSFGASIINEISPNNKQNTQLSSEGIAIRSGNVGAHVFEVTDESKEGKAIDNVAHGSMNAQQFALGNLRRVNKVSNLIDAKQHEDEDKGQNMLKDWHIESSFKTNGGSKLVGSGELGDVFSHGQPKPTSADSVDAITFKTSTLGDGMKRLKKLKRDSISGSNDADPAAFISEVKDVVQSHLENNLLPIQKYLHDGNREGAGLALKLMDGNFDSLVETRKDVHDLTASFDENSFSLENIPNDQLAQFIPLQALDDIVDHTQDLHKMLEEIDLSIFSTPSDQEALRNERFHRDAHHLGSDFFDFGFVAGQPSSHFFQSNHNGNSHLKEFFKNPSSTKNLWRHFSRMGIDSIPKLSAFTNFKDYHIIMAKHQLRVDALGDTCAPACNLENSTCLCGQLFDCIREMTEYDMAVLVAGGFIDTNPTSGTYGNFSIPADQLNLYKADRGVATKLASIKAKATGNPQDSELCNAVLGGVFSACDPDETTCANPNVQSFAVSSANICSTVNSNTKLLFEAIGEKFDNFVDKFIEAPCEPLSYDTCVEFTVHFDKLYEGRNISEYPLANPTLKNPSNTVHDQLGNNKAVFDRVQFPIRYNFRRDQQTGVVSREFSQDLTASTSPQYFFLVNPASGKVLGLSGGSCDNLTSVEVQERIYGGNSDHHQFTLTNDGRLENKSCGKVLSNQWIANSVPSCRDGNQLVLQTQSGINVNLQRWAFVGYGNGIVNSQCGQWKGDLAISAIEDDSIANIDFTDNIPIRFINPESNMAMGLESGAGCTHGSKITLQDVVEGKDEQTFYLKRWTGDSRHWQIHSKACPLRLLEITGTDCTTGTEVRLNRSYALQDPPLDFRCRDARGQLYQAVGKHSTHDLADCLRFCESLDGFENQVALSRRSNGRCHCIYEYGTLPSWSTIPTGSFTMPGQKGYGPPREHRSDSIHDIDWGCYPYIKSANEANQWRIRDGKLESAKCEGMVMEIQSTSTPSGSSIVLAPNNERGWNQAWSIKSNAARLLSYMGRPSQQWQAVSAKPAYDYALLPGFPGTEEMDDEKIILCHVKVDPFPRGLWQDNQYFRYNLTAWKTCFGPVPSGNAGTLVDVNQWRNCGDNVYTGKVRVWAPGAHDFGDNAVGRRDPYSSIAAGDFQNGDMLVRRDQTKSPCSACLSSTKNKNIAKSAMHSCDVSMSLLLGSISSVGTLRAVADLINEKGPEYMPGTCCMDTSINSQFFGYRYDPELEDSEGNKMTCQNHGPWHLGFSEEACENAGGKWYRTPCVTLQSCIDDRPPRFDLKAPFAGNCQDVLGKFNTGFVSSLTAHENFPFDSTTKGCFNFCQNLQEYPLQIGMEVEGSGVTDKVERCTCLYNNGQVPSKELLPEYATRSLPKFSLEDSTGSYALSLSHKSDCTADTISIEAKALSNGSLRQQFQLTRDGRIVSVACPKKVLTVGQCSNGADLQAAEPFLISQTRYSELDSDSSPTAPSLQMIPTASSLQQWTFNITDGSVHNDGCPDMKLSAMKSSNNRLHSYYFALSSRRTSLTMSVMGIADNCQDGELQIVLQEQVFGSPNQQFFVIGNITTNTDANGTVTTEGVGTLFSMMCPQLSIGIPGCDSESKLHLSGVKFTWKFHSNGKIESIKCPGKFIDIMDGVLGRGIASSTRPNLLSIFKFDSNRRLSLRTSNRPAFEPESFTPEIDINRTEYKSSNHINFTGHDIDDIQIPTWDKNVLPGVGTAMALSNRSTLKYQIWRMEYERFQPLVGPFTFVNPTSGFVIGFAEPCVHDMTLKAQIYDYSSLTQKFFLGKKGSIFSPSCPGLVVSIETSPDGCKNGTSEQSLRLQIFKDGANQMKWKFNKDGSIESVTCQGMLIGVGDGADLDLHLTDNTTDPNWIWRRQNVQLLDSNVPSTQGWMHDWSVSFVEPSYNVSDLYEFRGRDEGSTIRCYTSNSAFSHAFDNFASGFAIKDAADEDQCKAAREEIGLQPDHPFDTEVCEKFNKDMCDPFFTGVDHTTESLDEPPRTEEVEFGQVRYEEIEYEEVEYKAIQYKAAGYETVGFDKVKNDFEGYDDPDDIDHQNSFTDISISQVQKPTGVGTKEGLVHLQHMWLVSARLLAIAERGFEMTIYKMQQTCEAIPELPFNAHGPFRLACVIALILWEALASLNVVALEQIFFTINHRYERRTIGPNEVYDAYYYTLATHDKLDQESKWNRGAFEVINDNILAQHNIMLKELQFRHNQMTEDLTEDIFDTRNALGEAMINTQNAIGHALVESQNANGQLIVDTQNANGQAIVDAQNALGQSIVDARNANGQGIVDAQNALGQAIVDARNAMSNQHNQMLGWLRPTLCQVYEMQGGTCDSFIGPLEEHQEHIPLELDWPEGTPTVAGTLQQIEMRGDAFQEQVNAFEGTVRDSMDKVDAIEGTMKESMDKVDAIEDKVDAIEGAMKEMSGKIDTLEDSMREMKDMMSQLMMMMG